MSGPPDAAVEGAPSPPGTPAPVKAPRSRALWIVVGVVVIIALLILALLLTGVIPGLKHSNTPSAPTYAVTFSETGLPTGTSWSVTLASSTLSSTTSSIAFTESNGSYSFTVSATGYAASPASGSVVVAGAAVAKSIGFVAGFTVTFSESGLASSTSWSVTLSGTTLSSTTDSIVFTEANGTYPYTVGSVSGYSASPASGSVTVSGAAQTVPVTFTSVAPGSYTVTFSESGLSSGTSWSVTLNASTVASTGASIVFSETNGAYPYTVVPVSGYTANPSSGSVTVSGADQTVSITFSSSAVSAGPAYAVTFDQSGLPSTEPWFAEGYAKGTPDQSIFGTSTYGASDVFSIPNGTYSWYVDSVNTSYLAAPYDGTITVAGSAVTIHITFELLYAVTFTEVGLSTGAGWQVGLNGTTAYSNGPNNTFSEPDGSYSFGVYAFGYTASPATGSVTVSGRGLVETITFTALPAFAVTFTESGLATGQDWGVTLNGSEISVLAPSSISYSFPNGAYDFTVSSGGYYSASPASGSVTVSSATVTKSITFTAIPTYPVTFTESGLPSGTSWSVELEGNYNSTIAPGSIGFSIPSTTGAYFLVYATGYTASPNDEYTIVPESPTTVPITFTAIPPSTLPQVSVTESGLPIGSYWVFYVDSTYPVPNADYYCSNSSFTPSAAPAALTCNLPNGNYTWSVFTDEVNFTASPTSGGITVVGSAVSITTTFVNSTNQPLIWFAEESYFDYGVGGLPNGTSWSVTYNGSTVTTDGAGVFFLGPNGTSVAWSVKAPAGYVALPSSGYVTWYANPYQSFYPDELSAHVWIIFLALDPPVSAPIGADLGPQPVSSFVPALAVGRAP